MVVPCLGEHTDRRRKNLKSCQYIIEKIIRGKYQVSLLDPLPSPHLKTQKTRSDVEVGR